MPSQQISFSFAVVFLAFLTPVVLVHKCPDSCSSCTGPEKHTCVKCRAGWSLLAGSCVDIDECDSKLSHCPSGTYCSNTEGSYVCRGCDVACETCMGGGAARCRRCSRGYQMVGVRCSDVDECSENELVCPGLDEFCVNMEGSFTCQCAKGFRRKDGVCLPVQSADAVNKGLFDDIQEEEVEVLQQMFSGVLLCVLATLAAKGDMVYTSIFIGAVAAMAGYWLSDRSDRFLDRVLKKN